MSANNIPIKYKTIDGRRRMQILFGLVARKNKRFTMGSFAEGEREDIRWMWRNNILAIELKDEVMHFYVTLDGLQVAARAREIYEEEASAA